MTDINFGTVFMCVLSTVL